MINQNVPELHIDAEENVWHEIELKPQIERRKSSVMISEIEDELNFNQLTSDELEDYFDLLDIQEQLLSIKPVVKPRKNFYYLISLILPCTISKIKSSLLLDRDRIFAIALTNFDENEHMHFRLLITIYEILLQRRGYFKEKINRLMHSDKIQNYMLIASPNNSFDMSVNRTKSFRRSKHMKSFRKRDSSADQSIKSQIDVSDDIKTSTHDLSASHHDITCKSVASHNHYLNATNHESTRRNKSFDLSALPSKSQLMNGISNLSVINSEYKYRLENADVNDKIPTSTPQNSLTVMNLNVTNTDNSLESFPASLNSNFEYLSAAGLSSNQLNGQYSSADHLSINNNINNKNSYNRSLKRNRASSSRRSLRSATNHTWSGSRKSSNASAYSKRNSNSTLYNERVSITIFHRSIRYGDHWQQIGFQGNDPITDLRDLGLLSLFQLCFFLLNYNQLALQIYSLSLDLIHNFPFALTGINISQICLQTLRQGHLNRILNSKNEVFNTFNLFYSSLFLKFYELWLKDKKTIINSNEVLKELRILAATRPKQLIDQLFEFNKKTDGKPATKNDEKIIEFTDISKIGILTTDL